MVMAVRVGGYISRFTRKSNGPVEMDGRFPDKLFYRIGDVSEITGIKPYVLRYWESEFSGLRPRKTRSGQRIYERQHVELILEIKKLLYEQRYTVSGAKTLLARRVTKPAVGKAAPDLAAALRSCRQELRGLLAFLQGDGNGA